MKSYNLNEIVICLPQYQTDFLMGMNKSKYIRSLLDREIMKNKMTIHPRKRKRGGFYPLNPIHQAEWLADCRVSRLVYAEELPACAGQLIHSAPVGAKLYHFMKGV